MISNQLALYRFQQGVVLKIVSLLLDARGEIAEKVRESVEAGKGETYTGMRLKRVSAALDDAMGEAYRTVGATLENQLAGFASRSSDAVARVLEDALPFTFHMSRPDPGLLAAIATVDPFQGAVLARHVSSLEESARRALLRETRVGMTLGETTDQITRRVMGTKDTGPLATTYHQAAAVTRTAVQHVHAEARDLLFLGNRDVIGAVMGVVTLDERTCRVCGPRDGLVWRLPDYAPVGHEEGWGAGPGRWHFQCRCTSVPVLRDLDAFNEVTEAASGLDDAERAAMDGPVSVDVDYGEWLRGVDRAQRDRVLGKARAQWWDDHPGKTLAEAWAERFGGIAAEPATLDEAFPVPPPSPALEVPRFKTKKEATLWMEKELADEVKLGGRDVDVELLQGIADGLAYGMSLGGRGPFERLTRIGWTRRQGVEGFFRQNPREIMFQRQGLLKYRAEGPALREQWRQRHARDLRFAEAALDPSTPWTVRRLEELKSVRRWTVSSMEEGKEVYLVSVHEAAHAFHLTERRLIINGREYWPHRAWQRILDDAERAGTLTRRDILGISDYAGTNGNETWAELVTSVANGEDLGVFRGPFERMMELLENGRVEYYAAV